VVLVFDDEGGSGPGGVFHPEFLADLPGDVAFLAPGSVRAPHFPAAYNPLTGEFDTNAFRAVDAWLDSTADGLATEAAASHATAAGASEPTSNTSHLIFATSEQYSASDDPSVPPGTSGEFGNMAAADWYCTEAAHYGGLLEEPWDFQELIWTAYLSDSNIDAVDRIEITGPVYNTQGDLIAADADEFWSPHAVWHNPVGYDEFGDAIPPSPGNRVWTGSFPNGEVQTADHCSNWSSSTGNGYFGRATNTGSSAVTAGLTSCSTALRLCCISPAMTAQTTPEIQWDDIHLTYGEPLTEAELSAEATVDAQPVAGSYSYSIELGTVLEAGSGMIDVLFTPDDTSAYTTASLSVAFHIAPAPLVVTANDATWPVGTPMPSLSASISGFVLDEDESVLDGTLELATPADATSPVGNYPITASGLTAANYAISFLPGELTVVANADFDGDGYVDGHDFLAWQRGFGIASDATHAEGDANNDGAVDADDLTHWQAAFGTTTTPPEPELLAATSTAVDDESPVYWLELAPQVSEPEPAPVPSTQPFDPLHEATFAQFGATPLLEEDDEPLGAQPGDEEQENDPVDLAWETALV